MIMQLHDFQEDIIEDDSDTICLVKAREVGATTAFMQKAARLSSEGGWVIVLSPTLHNSKDALRYGVLQDTEASKYLEREMKTGSAEINWHGDGKIEAKSQDRIVDFLADPKEEKPDAVFVDNAAGLPNSVLRSIVELQEDWKLWVAGTPMRGADQELRELYESEDVSSYRVSAREVDHIKEERIQNILENTEDTVIKQAVEGEFVEKDELGTLFHLEAYGFRNGRIEIEYADGLDNEFDIERFLEGIEEKLKEELKDD